MSQIDSTCKHIMLNTNNPERFKKLLPVYTFFAHSYLMFPASLVLGIDPSLGRLDYASLSQQALMELLISGVKEVSKICGSREAPLDVAEWCGVQLHTSRETVRKIDWNFVKLGGSLLVQWAPSSLERMSIRHNSLVGSLETENLPANLRYLNLEGNRLCGTVDLTHLPACLDALDLSKNQLSNSIDLTRLPACLQELKLSHNQLSDRGW